MKTTDEMIEILAAILGSPTQLATDMDDVGLRVSFADIEARGHRGARPASAVRTARRLCVVDDAATLRLLRGAAARLEQRR